MVSENAYQADTNCIDTQVLCEQLEQVCINMPSNHFIIKNIKEMYQNTTKGDILEAAKNLVESDIQTVGILVGTTPNIIMWPPTDTDGPCGAFSLAYTLYSIGKSVIIISDAVNHDQIFPAFENSRVYKEAKKNKDDNRLQYIQFPGQNKWNDTDMKQLKEMYSQLNFIINCGRQGPGQQGEYWTHKLACITQYQPDFSLLFEWALEDQIPTMVIGDTGTELGMGKLAEYVKSEVENGEWLACEINAKYSLLSTVTDFGSFALCAAITLLHFKEFRNQYKLLCDIENLLPQIDDCATVLKTLVAEGARCGITGTRDTQIDGFKNNEIWNQMIEILRPLREAFAAVYHQNNDMQCENVNII